MALFDELNLTPNVIADEVEKSMSMGNVVPEGMYHAILDGARSISTNSGKGGRELTFRIVAGPCAGMVVKDAIWFADPDKLAQMKADPNFKDPATTSTINRNRIFAHRLGLLTLVQVDGNPNVKTYKQAEGKYDYTDVMGAQCVIDVINEEEEYTDKTGKKRKIMKSKLKFKGVYGLDEKETAKVVKATPQQVAQFVASANAMPSSIAGVGGSSGTAQQPTADQWKGL